MPDDNDTARTAQVAKLGVKLPPLWKSNIKLWFAQAESNFELSGITVDSTKYNNIVAAIDPETLSAVSDILLNPPSHDKYKTLKDRLIQEFSESENKQIRKLLSELQLGDEKPSHLLRKMQQLAKDSITDEFLKSLWFQRLPSDMQSILAVSSESLENLAKMADKIAEVRSDSSSVYAIGEPSRGKSALTADSPLNDISALRAEIAALSQKVERMSRSRSRDKSRGRYFKSPHRQFGSGEFCFYHQRFGKKARKCQEPCKYSNENTGN